MRDLLDAPRRGAERERLADLGLEDHLFVELADAHRPIGAGEEHAVEPAIGNRAGVGDRDALRAVASGQIVPCTRSHVMRGRSSANSSDG